MNRYPEKFARVFAAIAECDRAVLIHCAGGRDRTGLVSAMLLHLTGVEPGAILDNYADGFRGAARHRGHGMGYSPLSGEWVMSQDQHWSPAELQAAISNRLPAIRDWLASTDVAAYLLQAGLETSLVDRLAEMLRP